MTPSLCCLCYIHSLYNRYERDFDASDWPAAVEYGRNGDSPAPWNRVFADIAEDAQWIWTSDAENDDQVYCRVSGARLNQLPSCQRASYNGPGEFEANVD